MLSSYFTFAMCDFEKGFRLCTCGEKIIFQEAPLSRRKKGKFTEIHHQPQPLLQYIWILNRYKGKTEDIEMGRYVMPSEDLGKGLNADWIALNLNCEDCFDFDYTPSEGDNIVFRQNVILGPYISCIYRNGIWEIDHYDPFDEVTEKINEGAINPLQNNQ